MIKTSLPFPYKGSYEGTWNLFADDSSEGRRQACFDYFKSNRLNCVTFLIHAVPTDRKKYVVTSFFQGDPIVNYGVAAALDMTKANTLIRWMDKFNNAGILCAPTLLCDDDANIYPLGWDRHDAFLRCALPSLNPRVIAWIIGLESNKWTQQPNRRATWYKMAKQYTNLPVGDHIQGLPQTKLDFLSFEHHYNPVDSENHTVAECVTEGRNAIANAGCPSVFTENNWNPDSSHTRDINRGLAALPGCYGVGSPI